MKAATNVLEKLDTEKNLKTQIIIGLGVFIITTFIMFWVGVKHEGLIAGDMIALFLGAAYITFMDRSKVAYTNRLMAGLIIIASIRAGVALAVNSMI